MSESTPNQPTPGQSAATPSVSGQPTPEHAITIPPMPAESSSSQPVTASLNTHTATPPFTMPFEHIALAFSGGGFRAASFSLGVLAYLDRVKFDDHTLAANAAKASTSPTAQPPNSPDLSASTAQAQTSSDPSASTAQPQTSSDSSAATSQ